MKVEAYIPDQEWEGLMRRMEALTWRKQMEVTRILYKYAQKMANTAKDLAPYEFGQLTASITAYAEFLQAWFVAQVEYGKFQEYGTGWKGRAAGLKVVPLDYEYGGVSGIKPQPFMWPAFRQHFPALKDELARVFYGEVV